MIYFKHIYLIDPETVFICLSQLLFNSWISGILLIAILSAIISTISSLILIASNIIVEDFYSNFFKTKQNEEYILVNRITIIIVSIIGLIFASKSNLTVLDAVSFAWSGLGASFGPVILFSLYYPLMNQKSAILGMIIGALTVFICNIVNLKVFYCDIKPGFELGLGFIFNSLTIIIVSWKCKFSFK